VGAEDLGGGLWSVPVPIPGNPLGKTLVYVLDGPRGPVLIDAGWAHPDSWTALTSGLGEIGFAPGEIAGVVVTHCHPDHAGLAGRIREASGAWIAMHEEDIRLIQRMHEATGDELVNWVERAGATETERADFTNLVRGQMDLPAEPDLALRDGDLIDLPGRNLRVIWTPGHSPGHICLHLEDRGVLFTGDHVLPEITPHVGLYPYDEPGVDPLGTYLGSLTRTADLGVEDAMPAHEYRFSGVNRRSKEIIEHHEERLDELAALLGSEPETLWSLASRCHWSSPWAELPPLSKHLATGETAAHLRTLERRGRARRSGAGLPLSFSS
jgi:glyoxylase-like metal-dependent hydrolase (beta-lactamase superfamily II)